MKKKLLYPFIILFLIVTTAQTQVVYEHDFSDGNFLPEGWGLQENPSNWSLSETSNAGGSSPELFMNYTPDFTGKSRILLPPMDLSGNMADNLVISFKQMIDRYAGLFYVGLEYRTNNGGWNSVWRQLVSSDFDAEERVIVLDQTFPVTSSNIQFSFYFDGVSANLNAWYIDDILIYLPGEADGALKNIDLPDVIAGEETIKGVIENKGEEKIYSFDLNWQNSEGVTFSESFYGLELGLFETFEFETNQKLTAPFGESVIDFNISDINGFEEDANMNNNDYSVTIMHPEFTAAKKPFFESFTSSTCGPCASFNLGFFNNFLNNNSEDLHVIKYQMNWPGGGDPYYNSDGGQRRNYYGVNSVPDLLVNGETVGTSSTAVNNVFNETKNEQALLDIQGGFFVEDNTIHIEGVVFPYYDYGNVKLQVAIAEKSTTGNSSSNGESIFYSVMMKMLPNGSGTTVDLQNNERYEISHSFDMTNTDVEQMDDLKVIVFLQNDQTKEIIQSTYLNASTDGVPVVSSVPEQGDVNVSVWDNIVINFDQMVRLQDSKDITPDELSNLISFHETNNESNTIDFTAQLNQLNSQIIISPSVYLTPDTEYTVSVNPLLGYWEYDSDVYTFSFTTRQALGAPEVSLDPVDGTQDVDLNYLTLEVNFDQQVRNPDGTTFVNEDVSNIVELFPVDDPSSTVSISGAFSNDFTHITVTPLEMLLANTEYTIKVNEVLGEDDVLSLPVESDFHTRESIGTPTVLFDPQNNASEILQEEQIIIAFSQPMRTPAGEVLSGENVSDFFQVYSETDDVPPAVTIVPSQSGNVFILSADEGWNLGTNYFIDIMPLQGMEGDLTETINYSFSTRPSLGAPVATFSVTNNSLSVPVNEDFTIEIDQSVTLPDGSSLTNENVEQVVFFHVGEGTEGEAVDFTATINAEKTLITVSPVEILQTNTTYTLGLNALMGIDGDVSETVAVSFTTTIFFSVDDIQNNNVRIYPQPASDIITIDVNHVTGESKSLKLFDLGGKTVYSMELINPVHQIDISALMEGVYLIEIVGDNFIFRDKVILEK